MIVVCSELKWTQNLPPKVFPMATLVEAMSELKLTPETSESLMVEFKVRKPGRHTWKGWVRQIGSWLRWWAFLAHLMIYQWISLAGATRAKAHILRQRRIGDQSWELSGRWLEYFPIGIGERDEGPRCEKGGTGRVQHWAGAHEIDL